MVEASLPDEPGTLAEAARRLAKAGVNIEAAFPAGTTGSSAHILFATDNPTKAKQALGEPVGATTRSADSAVEAAANRSEAPGVAGASHVKPSVEG